MAPRARPKLIKAVVKKTPAGKVPRKSTGENKKAAQERKKSKGRNTPAKPKMRGPGRPRKIKAVDESPPDEVPPKKTGQQGRNPKSTTSAPASKSVLNSPYVKLKQIKNSPNTSPDQKKGRKLSSSSINAQSVRQNKSKTKLDASKMTSKVASKRSYKNPRFPVMTRIKMGRIFPSSPKKVPKPKTIPERTAIKLKSPLEKPKHKRLPSSKAVLVKVHQTSSPKKKKDTVPRSKAVLKKAHKIVSQNIKTVPSEDCHISKEQGPRKMVLPPGLPPHDTTGFWQPVVVFKRLEDEIRMGYMKVGGEWRSLNPKTNVECIDGNLCLIKPSPESEVPIVGAEETVKSSVSIESFEDTALNEITDGVPRIRSNGDETASYVDKLTSSSVISKRESAPNKLKHENNSGTTKKYKKRTMPHSVNLNKGLPIEENVQHTNREDNSKRPKKCNSKKTSRINSGCKQQEYEGNNQLLKALDIVLKSSVKSFEIVDQSKQMEATYEEKRQKLELGPKRKAQYGEHTTIKNKEILPTVSSQKLTSVAVLPEPSKEIAADKSVCKVTTLNKPEDQQPSKEREDAGGEIVPKRRKRKQNLKEVEMKHMNLDEGTPMIFEIDKTNSNVEESVSKRRKRNVKDVGTEVNRTTRVQREANKSTACIPETDNMASTIDNSIPKRRKGHVQVDETKCNQKVNVLLDTDESTFVNAEEEEIDASNSLLIVEPPPTEEANLSEFVNNDNCDNMSWSSLNRLLNHKKVQKLEDEMGKFRANIKHFSASMDKKRYLHKSLETKLKSYISALPSSQNNSLQQ